jgi:CheY-like chemotaxis protein
MPDPALRVLVLDDEESIRQSIAAYFEDEGIVVFQASSGEDALDIVRTTAVDAAVVDIRLPGMDGNTFMIKAGQLRPGMRFVVHTGSADYILPESVMTIGVGPDKVFIKPVHDLRILVQALDPT